MTDPPNLLPMNPPFVLKGYRSRSIVEPAIPVKLNDENIGRFQALNIFERVSGTDAYPQTIADIVSNTYLRLTYQKPDGSSGTFGTSIVGTISFRTSDGVLRFIPQVVSAKVQANPDNSLEVQISGVFGGFARMESTRTYSTNAQNSHTKMRLEVKLTALRDIHLNRAALGSDAVRLFTLSSMYLNPQCYDGNVIEGVGGQSIAPRRLDDVTSRPSYLFEYFQNCSTVKIVNEMGSRNGSGVPGSKDSPSVKVCVLESSMPGEELGLQGYLVDSKSSDDDSLSVWIEWVRCPPVISQGEVISATMECMSYSKAEHFMALELA